MSINMKHILVQSILFVKLFIRRTMDIIQMVGTNIRSYCFYCLHLIIFEWNIWKVCVLFPAINNDSHHIQTCSVCETQFFFQYYQFYCEQPRIRIPTFWYRCRESRGKMGENKRKKAIAFSCSFKFFSIEYLFCLVMPTLLTPRVKW